MGQLTIPDHATVYVDTAPVIYSVELHPDSKLKRLKTIEG